MKRPQLRWIGGGMTTIAVAVLLAVYGTVAPVPVAAAFCCEECDARLTGCETGCQSTAHDDEGDSVGVCTDDCIDMLHSCFAHCNNNCNPPGGGSACVQYYVFHNRSCTWSTQAPFFMNCTFSSHVLHFSTGPEWCN